MQRVRDTAGSVRNWFSDLRLVQKVGIIGIAVVLLGVLVATRLATRPQFGVLYTDLAGDDYNKVVNWLDTSSARRTWTSRPSPNPVPSSASASSAWSRARSRGRSCSSMR
jgi:flagellar biosynthesis/type III secretory pathway M-ring protein FliF/YscJ